MQRPPKAHKSQHHHLLPQGLKATRSKRQTAKTKKRPQLRSTRTISSKTQSTATKTTQNYTQTPYTICNTDVAEKIAEGPGASKRPSASSPYPAGLALYISNVLPDNNATAAGIRTFGVLRSLKALGFFPIVLTPSRLHSAHQKLVESYTNLGIPIVRCEINETDGGYESFIRGLANGTFIPQQFIKIQNDLKIKSLTNSSSQPDVVRTNEQSVQMNDANSDALKTKLSLVIYDRYVVEEIFGLKTREALPSTNPISTVIDTQDLHFLRLVREEIITTKQREERHQHKTPSDITDPTTHPIFSNSPHTIFKSLLSSDSNLQRELAPYFRSDFVLTVSENESILLNLLGVPQAKTLFLPITHANIPQINTKLSQSSNGPPLNNHDNTDHHPSPNQTPNQKDQHSIQFDQIFEKPFERRANSMFIGTMRHPPNVNCVEQLRDVYVPLIKQHGNQINVKMDAMNITRDNISTNPPSEPTDYNHSISKARAALLTMYQKLNQLKLLRSPSIHIYGTYMTKEQNELTIALSQSDIDLDMEITDLDHKVNVIGTALGQINSLIANRDQPINTISDLSSFHIDDQVNSILASIGFATNSVSPPNSNSATKNPIQKNSFAQKGPFVMKGTAKHAIRTISQYKSLFSPLLFGAGVKGKVIDAWISGTPVIATPITAEGLGIEFNTQGVNNTTNTKSNQIHSSPDCCQLLPLNQAKCAVIRSQLDQYCTDKYGSDTPINTTTLLNTQWPGVVHTDPSILSLSTLLLDSCKCEWIRQHDKISPILSSFSDEHGTLLLRHKLITSGGFDPVSGIQHDQKTNQHLQFSPDSLSDLRSRDFIGQLLYHRNNNSQFYMPRYINAKNELAAVKGAALKKKDE